MILFLSIVFIIISLILVFLVIITPSSEGGIAAAFGGMGSDSFFGTKAHSHINKTVVVLSVLFLTLAIAINLLNTRRITEEGGEYKKVNPDKPAPTETLPGLPGTEGSAPPE